MLRLVVLALAGTFISLTVARPAPTSKTTVSVPVPTKYAACKARDCPPFRVVKKITPTVELREYYPAWWASTKAQVSKIDSNVTVPMYWSLRSYLARNNKQNRYITMAVPVTKLMEMSSSGTIGITISFYLSVPYPPQPINRSKFNMVWLEYKPLHVYVKIIKKRSFKPGITKRDADDLANELVTYGFDGTFYPPSSKYLSVGYDSPLVPREERTNEVWLIKMQKGSK